MRVFYLLVFTAALTAITACTPLTPKDRLPEFHSRKPASILVVPVINQSVDVEAPLAVLTTLPKLLAKRGYYVFPVNTVKTLLEFEGLYEANEVHAVPAPELAELFGADSILYITVHEWTTQYVLISAKTIVDLEYKIVASDGTLLWQTRKQKTYRPESQTSSSSATANLLSAVIDAAVERLDPKFIALAREANDEAFLQGVTPLPPGPYASNFDDYYLALYPPEEEQ